MLIFFGTTFVDTPVFFFSGSGPRNTELRFLAGNWRRNSGMGLRFFKIILEMITVKSTTKLSKIRPNIVIFLGWVWDFLYELQKNILRSAKHYLWSAKHYFKQYIRIYAFQKNIWSSINAFMYCKKVFQAVYTYLWSAENYFKQYIRIYEVQKIISISINVFMRYKTNYFMQ